MKTKLFLLISMTLVSTCFFTACNVSNQQSISSLTSPNTQVADSESASPIVTDEVSPTPTAQMIIQSETEENGIKQITVTASEIEDTFVIDIIPPKGYDATKKYPVLYITDGNWRREEYKDIQSLSSDGSIVDLILVGICYPDSYDVDTIRKRDLVDHPDTFLSFIINDIIGYMNANYSIDTTNQTLWGSSYGGYFTLYSLLQSNGLTKDVFHNYIFASPTLRAETNGKSLFDLEETLYTQTKELNLNVYMSVGSLEEQRPFLKPFHRFDEIFKSRDYKGLNYTSKVYEGKDHYTVGNPTMLDGLKMFLSPSK
jgi:predicted alpha/beta superfamily hydrolase